MIRALYLAAIVNNHQSLVLLIDYLTKVRNVLSLEDDSEKIKYYLKSEFKNKMNEYLAEYNEAMKMVIRSKEVNVYQVRFYDSFFYLAAFTQEEAESFFKAEYGELHEIRIEIPELEVEGEDGVQTLRQIIMKTKSFPSILGYWELMEESKK
jgi:hypothetical protein